MRSSLFRQEALEARRVSLVGSTLIARRFPLRLATGLSVLAATALVALCCFGEYTRKVRVEGYLAPSTGVVEVFAGQTGTLVSKRVGEGQTVHRGDFSSCCRPNAHRLRRRMSRRAETAAIQARMSGLEQESEARQRVTRMQLEGTRQRLKSMQSERVQIQGMEVLQRQRLVSSETALGAYERLRLEGFSPRGRST